MQPIETRRSAALTQNGQRLGRAWQWQCKIPTRPLDSFLLNINHLNDPLLDSAYFI